MYLDIVLVVLTYISKYVINLNCIDVQLISIQILFIHADISKYIL